MCWMRSSAESRQKLADSGSSDPTFQRDEVQCFALRCGLDSGTLASSYTCRRVNRVLIEIYDGMKETINTNQPYQTRQNPSPADLRRCHLPRWSSETWAE